MINRANHTMALVDASCIGRRCGCSEPYLAGSHFTRHSFPPSQLPACPLFRFTESTPSVILCTFRVVDHTKSRPHKLTTRTLVLRIKYRQALPTTETSAGDHIIVMAGCYSMSKYTPSDTSLNTEVAISNHFEAVTSKRQRLHDAGFFVVDRSIVKIGREIGSGGQGTVYEASVSWPNMDKAVKMAVKKFKSQLGISQGQYPLELWSKNHFHVLRPRAFFFDHDGSLCMLMPLFSSDLRIAIDIELKKTKKSGPPYEDVLSFSIIMQLAFGMNELHSVGVCHRDLKAANILLMSIPTPKALEAQVGCKIMHWWSVADFETSENVKGTAFWRAPEVSMFLRTRIPLTDREWQAADVYSFGMVCYEIVTGEIPFYGNCLTDCDIVIYGGRPELPNYVPELLRKMLAFKSSIAT